MNLWMKRAIGVAALGGGLLAFGAGAASAQEVSADVRLGRSTSADVRVCADGRVLSGVLGSCGSGGTSVTVQAGRGSAADGASGVRARARAPRVASADVSLGTRRSRSQTTGSGQATASGQAGAGRSATADAGAAIDTSPRAQADATAQTLRPGGGLLLDLGLLLASPAGAGLLGTSPFTLVGDAADRLLPIGELTLDGLAGQAPAGIGVLESGPIGSGNQATANVGDASPSVPVTVCGNGAGVLGDASASCGATQPAGSAGPAGSSGTGASIGASGTGSSGTGGSLLDNAASGNQVDAGIGSVSPSVPLTVCGNGVGALGDASASCGATQPGDPGGPAAGGSPGSSSGGSTQASGTLAGNQADVTAGDVAPSACGDGVDLLGDATVGCGTTSSGGIIAPPPGTPVPPGQTDTVGILGTPSTGTAGTTGTQGLTPGTSGGPAGSVTSFAPLRPLGPGAGALPFTGAAGDLLALFAAGLLAAGAILLRAVRPAAVREGGGDR